MPAIPTEVFVVARVVAAVLGTVAVWFTYLAGARFFNRTVGLLAAAIFGLAFLPVFYSHLALNDVPTLAPVALALYAASGVMRRGRRRDYVLAGHRRSGWAPRPSTPAGSPHCACSWLAICDATDGARGRAARRLALAAAVALVAFVIANPYALLDFSAFRSGVSQQALAGRRRGSGQARARRPGNGITYYLWTFTWGLGLGAGARRHRRSRAARRRRRIGLALALIPASASRSSSSWAISSATSGAG